MARSQQVGRGMNGAGVLAEDARGPRSASALVVVVLCLLMIFKLADAGLGTASRMPFVAVLFVLPLLYAVPGTRSWWMSQRWWLLAAQAVLTYVPFAVFGNGWVGGMSGLLAGLVLLTVTAPASWLLFGALTVVEEVLWTAVGGLPNHNVASAALYLLIAYSDVAFVLFGLARLADMVAQLHAARSQLADLAVSRERLRAAESLRSAVGERLASVAALAESAQHALASTHARAREQISQAGLIARRAVADVRGATATDSAPARSEDPPGFETGAVVAPRLARTILGIVVCGFALESVNVVLAAHVGPAATALAVVSAVAIVALQLRHSWQSPGGGRPYAWQWTLGLQATLTYATLPLAGPLDALVLAIFAGFLAGSALLLLPGRWAWAAYAAVVLSPAAAYAANPGPGTYLAQISYVIWVRLVWRE